MASQLRMVSLTQDGDPSEPMDAARLLAVFGRECAGAVAIAPSSDGWRPGPGRYDPITDDGMHALIENLPSAPLSADVAAGRRMSLAGAQPKLVLARFDGRWYKPADGAASTHILKPSRNWLLRVDNEAVVMGLARSIGLTDAGTWVEEVGDETVYVTERYDRRVTGTGIVDRVHQEDMCQSLGIRPRDKYCVGRPSAGIASILGQFGSNREAELRGLLRQVAFRTIVGDEDGHGKKYAVLLVNHSATLAPLYDSLSTILYPRLTGKMGARCLRGRPDAHRQPACRPAHGRRAGRGQAR
ncbi:MAG: HipA domain-containing protein [Acidimicrobiales bacterium]